MNKWRWKQTGLALLAAVISFGGNFINNALASLVVAQPLWILGAIGIALLIFALVYRFARPRLVTVQMETPLPLRTQAEQERHAHRGLVLAVSLYRPQPDSPAAKLPIDERIAAACAGNYAALDLPHSNLAPLLAAIQAHASRLEHIWLITTTSTSRLVPGSDFIIPALQGYIREVLQLKIIIHADPQTSVPLEDDALVTVKTRDLVNLIFRQAQKLNLKDEEILVDITGGMRSVQLGFILACLDRRRKIQFIGTHYRDNGETDSTTLPILFDYSPILDED